MRRSEAGYVKGMHLIPEHMHGAILRYVENGIPPGSFLEAVLCNQFKEAFQRADSTNIENMKGYAEYVYWYLPSACHGSPTVVAQWIAQRGLKGLEDARSNAAT